MEAARKQRNKKLTKKGKSVKKWKRFESDICTTVEDNLEVFVNVEEDTAEKVFGNVEEDIVEEVFVNVVASASVEEETGVKNLTSNNNTLIDPNKMKVKELKF